MEAPDIRRLWNANARAWTELSRAGFDVHREARDLVDESMRSDAEDAPALLIDGGNAVSGGSEALSYLGAGPVEDFVVYRTQGGETLYHRVG